MPHQLQILEINLAPIELSPAQILSLHCLAEKPPGLNCQCSVIAQQSTNNSSNLGCICMLKTEHLEIPGKAKLNIAKAMYIRFCCRADLLNVCESNTGAVAALQNTPSDCTEGAIVVEAGKKFQ